MSKLEYQLWGWSILRYHRWSILGCHNHKSSDLLASLPDHFRNSAQIRYELLKLRARGVVVKMKNKSFYMVTQKGWCWLWLEITSTTYFKNPMISKNLKMEAAQLAKQPSELEEAYDLINRGLSQITRELAVIQ
jgi:hypothetical protein